MDLKWKIVPYGIEKNKVLATHLALFFFED